MKKQNRQIWTSRLSAMVSLLLLTTSALAADAPSPSAAASRLPVQVVRMGDAAMASSFEGVVEAERQSMVAAQVAGAVVQLNVRAGDRVSAGQVLLRLDAQAAQQGAAASQAQVAAAQAQLVLAAQSLNRSKQLYEKGFIAKAAMDQADAGYRAAQAQVKALQAQAGAAQTQADFYVVRSPYAGVVAALNVEMGDMVMPGRLLLTVYDPAELRVAASLPSTLAQGLAATASAGQMASAAKLDIPALREAGQAVAVARVRVLPTVDAQSMTQVVRLTLPALHGALPGQFARVWVQGKAHVAPEDKWFRASAFIPASAVLKRAEMTGVYVLGPQGQPLLRQVRLGRSAGAQVEVLSGLDDGDKLVLQPEQAVRLTSSR